MCKGLRRGPGVSDAFCDPVSFIITDLGYVIHGYLHLSSGGPMRNMRCRLFFQLSLVLLGRHRTDIAKPLEKYAE